MPKEPKKKCEHKFIPVTGYDNANNVSLEIGGKYCEKCGTTFIESEKWSSPKAPEAWEKKFEIAWSSIVMAQKARLMPSAKIGMKGFIESLLSTQKAQIVEKLKVSPYSMPPLDDTYLVCPSCKGREFVCKECFENTIKSINQIL